MVDSADDIPPAPAGFHYRGEEPQELSSDNFSKLARRCSFAELKQSRKERYRDLYRRIGDVKGKPVIMCVCGKTYSCAYNKNCAAPSDDIDIGNYFAHVKSVHPWELTAKDQGEAAAIANGPPKGTLLTPGAFTGTGFSSSAGKLTPTAVKKRVCHELASMIANKGSFPLSMVEDVAFREGLRRVVAYFSPGSVPDPDLDLIQI